MLIVFDDRRRVNSATVTVVAFSLLPSSHHLRACLDRTEHCLLSSRALEGKKFGKFKGSGCMPVCELSNCHAGPGALVLQA
eukprot:767495-Hanusia_phi.AAC.3